MCKWGWGGGEGAKRERLILWTRLGSFPIWNHRIRVFPQHSLHAWHSQTDFLPSGHPILVVLAFAVIKWMNNKNAKNFGRIPYLLEGAFARPLIGCSIARAEQVCVLPRPLLLDHSLSNNRRLSYSGCLEIWGVELPNWSKYSSSLIRPDPAARWRGVRPIRCDLLVNAC